MENEMLTIQIEQADKLYQSGRLDEAKVAYQAILDEAPDAAWAHSRIGAILAQTGDALGAEAALTKAIELDPGLAQAHSNLGNLFYARGDYKGALEKYQQAVSINPNNVVFHQNLHAAYKKLGLVKESVAELKLAHRLDRQAATEGAKAKVQDIKKNVKGRFGCLSVLVLLLLIQAGILLMVL